jgi:hypothetical protein
MTPERQAESAIERTIQEYRDADPAVIARVAVEAMAAQRLVIMTAARATELIDAERRARVLEPSHGR